MKSLIYACLLLVMMPGLVQAQPMKFAYQAVMHVRESHTTKVLDRVDHVVGIGTFRGLAIFDNGEVAIHRYEGWFDLVNGSGKFQGYALWKFEDGSEIRAGYNGVAKSAGNRGFHVEARFAKFTGTGRFAKSKIQGSFSGRRFEAISNGGSTHLKGELFITTDT